MASRFEFEGGDPTPPNPEAQDEVNEVPPPEGYDDAESFMKETVRLYNEDRTADAHNIEQAEEDLRFIYVDQWDNGIRAAREAKGRPCLTVNTLPQFIGQVVGDRRINKTSVKVLANQQGNKEEARIRSGLIKSIESYSRAERVYDACCEDQVGCGVSNFEITMEYSRNDVFEQDLFVRMINNPLAVVWDRFSKDPTGRDAQHCFVEESMSKQTFRDMFGEDAIPGAFTVDTSYNSGEFVEGDNVKIVAFWRMIERPALFALMQDGQVEDVTEMAEEDYGERLWLDPQTNEPMVRESVRSYAQRWLLTSFKILEGPYELPLQRLPIIKVSGRIGRVGGKQYRFGLVRWARDPSSLRNYWRSVAAETLALAPKSQWIADAGSVKGREDDFRDAHLTGDPLLVYNTGKEAPRRIDAPQLPSAVLNEANMNAQDIKDVTGIHDASLGIRSNEVSGKAIMARQREGDVATITYHDNLNNAIQEGGEVLNDLIPICYDSTRIIRIVGIDDAEEFIPINDPADADAPDISSGKYDVTLTTGPSYTTQRMEAADAMLETVKTFPQIMEIAGDIMVESQDWPGSERIAARLKKALPAAQAEEQEKQQQENGGQPAEPSPEEQQAQAAQEQALQVQRAQVEAQLQELQLKLREQEAKTMQAEAQAQQSQSDTIRAEADARAAIAQAAEAEAKATIAQHEIEFRAQERGVQIRQAANPPQQPNNRKPKRGGASRSDSRPRT